MLGCPQVYHQVVPHIQYCSVIHTTVHVWYNLLCQLLLLRMQCLQDCWMQV